MQSVALIARRLYSTKPPAKLPHAARVARTASTPLAVRLRRRKKFGPVAAGATDSTPEGLTPTELARYKRLEATGKLEVIDDEPVTEAQWLEKLDERRSRVRGIKTVERDGTEETEVVGRRVYLPNIIIRLVRNNTPKGEPYNPYEATFRIPKSVTKTDLRSYLLAIYGVQTTYIRTDNYISPIFPRLGNKRKAFKTYKRAVVGLVDPFYYPQRLEDMPETERAEREKWIEDNFQIQATRSLQKYELLRMTKGQAKGWKMKEPMATKRSHILRLVAERREKREGLIIGQAREWQEMRERGERITLDKLKSPSTESVVPPTQEHSSVPATAN
ncbi:putative ribosomal protein L23 [Lyophyllum shimeji]|uniref:Large ribosomal subunit protein uL23m n=1 Tax=Lyophyllum shimeji TaxID=47721 RepID=A0A9P3UR12_LYOSH|nr:putative ribosomal protein L23 [Lyophyllum shimeji]